ncbi:hypothetical protein KP509_07G063700 [Ceratopteris richardii]|nr:hypothetical protein KP509_07G063700 [Ceratopteris richardii]
MINPNDPFESPEIFGSKTNEDTNFQRSPTRQQQGLTKIGRVPHSSNPDKKIVNPNDSSENSKLSGMNPNSVPKFGNFNSDDQVQYTLVFDTARADHKAATGADKTINNPNDPSKNLASFGMKSNELLASSTGKKIKNPNDPFESPELFGMKTNEGTNFQRPPIQQQQGPTKIGRVQHSSNPQGGKQTNGELATSIGSPNHPSAPEVRLGNRTPAHASYLGLDRKEQNQAVPPLPASLPTAGRPGLRENMVGEVASPVC